MRPGKRLLTAAGLWLALGALASLLPALGDLWRLAGLLVAIAAVADWLLLRSDPQLEVTREVATSLPVGVASEVRLRLVNRGHRNLKLDVHDHHPASGIASGLPLALAIAPGKSAQFAYRFTPLARGDAAFVACDLRIESPLRLWQRTVHQPLSTAVRIYPNFAALTGYALLATDNHLSQIGILQRRRRGEGTDFHQLREYREGDAQRQIDWNATARTRKLIARDYRDERDQQIVFLIDCGRRMSAADSDLSHLRHFDHVLNAALLLAYVSLRQGDAVGYLTFGTPAPRFLAPRKSGATVSLLLGGLYDIQPGLMMPDYYQVAIDASRRLKRRALVIILSNLRDEDDDTLAPALALLRQRHLVLFASLREPSLDAALARPVSGLGSALTHAAAVDYMQQRAATLRRIEHRGGMVLDVPPERLPIALVNRYLDIKRTGRL